MQLEEHLLQRPMDKKAHGAFRQTMFNHGIKLKECWGVAKDEARGQVVASSWDSQVFFQGANIVSWVQLITTKEFYSWK